MKRTLAAFLALLPLAAMADRQSTVVEARVVSAEPIVRVVSERIPHERCREERVRVVGASVGSDMGRRRHERSYYVTEEVCSVEYELREREEVDGYRVRYRYSGNIYETRTQREPGRSIPVRVEIQPLS